MAKLALQGNDAGTGTFTLQAPATNLNRNLVLPDVDGTLSTMEQVKLPIGSFMWFTGTVAPEAFIVADGQLRSRAAFPDLWAFAQTSGNISVDDASWDEGKYSPGDGATTFRVPKVDDRFIRGKSGTRHVGLVEEDALQGHIHKLWGSGTAASGERYIGGMLGSNDTPTGAMSHFGADGIISDGTNGTPRTADETRPKALTMLPCIKAYDVISDPNVLNAVEVVNEISRLESEKLRKDENINLGVSVVASGTAVDFVGIPEGVKRITVMFDGVSTNGSSVPIIQIGASSGVYTSSYKGTAGNHGSGTPVVALFTTGFAFAGGWASSISARGLGVITAQSNVCLWSAMIGRDDAVGAFYGGGTRTLDAPINTIRITTVNGTDKFDAGTINISWEF